MTEPVVDAGGRSGPTDDPCSWHVRCVPTPEVGRRAHHRVLCGASDDLAAQVVHDVLVLPTVWRLYLSQGPATPWRDRGRLLGVEAPVPAGIVESGGLLPGAEAVARAAARALADVRGRGRSASGAALHRAARHRIAGSHELALAVTAAGRVGSAGAVSTRESLVETTVALVESRVAQGVVPSVFVTAGMGPSGRADGPGAHGDASCGWPSTTGPPAPALLEVRSVGAELACVHARVRFGAVDSTRALAATLTAAQALFGPYESVLDRAVRFTAAVSYLWDCIVDWDRQEFLLLAAPAVDDLDRLLELIRTVVRDGPVPSDSAVAAARRIVRTRLFEATGTGAALLGVQARLHRAGLPAHLLAELDDSLRDVTVGEVVAASAGITGRDVGVTVVIPAAAGSVSRVLPRPR